jgi:hypothetical protein
VPAVAAALLGLGATVVLSVREARVATAAALLLTALALTRRTGPTVAVAGWGAAAYAAVSAGLLVADLHMQPGAPWSAAGGAALAVGTLLAAGLPVQRLRLLPVLVAGAAAAVIGAGVALWRVPVPVLAATLLVVVALAVVASPWWVVDGLVRVEPAGGGGRSRPVDVARVAAEARLARELLEDLAIGLGAVEVALAPVACRLGGAGAALAGCACALTVLRGRHPHDPGARAARVAGTTGLLVTAVAGLWLHPSWRPVGGALLAGVGGALLLLPRRGDDAPLAAAALRVTETLCLVGLLPLLVAATDVVDRLPP